MRLWALSSFVNWVKMVIWYWVLGNCAHLFNHYFFCYFGKVTHHFNGFNKKLCDCNWFLFPNKMKRIYLIVLSGTQQPAVIQGYGNTVCTRDAFKKVILYFVMLYQYFDLKHNWFQCHSLSFQTINGGFSYFTMLHRMDG